MIEDRYYIFCESWSLTIGQWGILLTFLSIVSAYILYYKQRRDNAKEAYLFFKSSIDQLASKVDIAISQLSSFKISLDNPNDNFGSPSIPASINDKFLDKINIVALSRYFSKSNKDYKNFQKFLTDSSFFGDYHNFFINEFNYFRENYLVYENKYIEWKQLVTVKYYDCLKSVENSDAFKEEYISWHDSLMKDESVIKDGAVINRERLIKEYVIQLGKISAKHIADKSTGIDISMHVKRVVDAYNNMINLKKHFSDFIEKDIKMFEKLKELIILLVK